MTFSHSLINCECRFEVQDSTGKCIGQALAALSQNRLYWDFKEIIIDENQRGNKHGTKLLDYARNHLWKIEELPIRVHVGVDPIDLLLSQVNLDINKKFYSKCGFEEEGDGKQMKCFPPNYQQ